jgi:hypothetical protein
MAFGRGRWTISRIFLLVAVIAFVLAAIGVDVSGLSLVPIGLAFGFGSFLVT